MVERKKPVGPPRERPGSKPVGKPALTRTAIERLKDPRSRARAARLAREAASMPHKPGPIKPMPRKPGPNVPTPRTRKG